MILPRLRSLCRFSLTGLVLALVWLPATAEAADLVGRQEAATLVVDQSGSKGVITDWEFVWSRQDPGACTDQNFSGPDHSPWTAIFLSQNQTTAEYLFQFPAASSDGFVCGRGRTSQTAAFLYLDPVSITIETANLTAEQRNNFLILTADRPMIDSSWQLLGSFAVDPGQSGCQSLVAKPGQISQPLESLSDRQAVLNLRTDLNRRWVCLAATDQIWQSPVVISDHVSRLEERVPRLSFDLVEANVVASSDREVESWYHLTTPTRPDCSPNPVVGPGQVSDPPLSNWAEGPRAPLVDGEDDELWVCFLARTTADDAGNHLFGYGLYQHDPDSNPPTWRGLVWLIGLNLLIICAGSAIGILMYRR